MSRSAPKLIDLPLTRNTGDLAIEGFTCMIIFKNFFSYGLTYQAYNWLLQNGTHGRPVFNALATVQLIICLSSIPMCTSSRPLARWLWVDPKMSSGSVPNGWQISLASECEASSIATTSSRCFGLSDRLGVFPAHVWFPSASWGSLDTRRMERGLSNFVPSRG